MICRHIVATYEQHREKEKNTGASGTNFNIALHTITKKHNFNPSDEHDKHVQETNSVNKRASETRPVKVFSDCV